MSGGLKFVKLIRNACRRKSVVTGTAVTLVATSVGLKWNDWSNKVKDKIIFMSKEENENKSSLDITASNTKENRDDPVLPNGEINWACTCIEKEVVGPCNIQFRALREFMHKNQVTEDISHFSPSQKKVFDKVMEDYIVCTMDNPVYYKEGLLPEEIEDMEREKAALKAEEERKARDREEHTRRFDEGKHIVYFMSKEENNIPSTVKIPTRDNLEENRDPVFPDGTLNWGCTCIEKEVVGPCNNEFRVFRQFIHDAKTYKDQDLPVEKQAQLHDIIGHYLNCARKHPKYYRLDRLLKEDNENGDNDKNTSDSLENK